MDTRAIVSSLLPVVSALLLSGCKPGSSEEEAKAPTEVAVQVAKVTRVTLRARVDAYGTVEAELAGGGKPAGAARLSAPTAGIVTAVPRESIYTDYDGKSTLSIVEGDVARQKVVKVGLRNGDLVEGESLTEGATVATLGSYALPQETKDLGGQS
jgi:hypothetical protein